MHIPVPKQVREEMEEAEGEKMKKGGKKDTGRRGGQRGEKREINGGQGVSHQGQWREGQKG